MYAVHETFWNCPYFQKPPLPQKIPGFASALGICIDSPTVAMGNYRVWETQATIDRGFTLKCVPDMVRTYRQDN